MLYRQRSASHSEEFSIDTNDSVDIVAKPSLLGGHYINEFNSNGSHRLFLAVVPQITKHQLFHGYKDQGKKQREQVAFPPRRNSIFCSYVRTGHCAGMARRCSRLRRRHQVLQFQLFVLYCCGLSSSYSILGKKG